MVLLIQQNIPFVGGVDDPAKLHSLSVQAAIAVEARDRLHAGAQFGAIKRFGQKIVGAGGQPLQLGGAIIQRRHHHNRHFGQGRVGAQPAADFIAIHAGHHHVEQDQVRAQGVRQLQGLRPILRQHQFVIVVEQGGLHCAAPGGIVIDD